MYGACKKGFRLTALLCLVLLLCLPACKRKDSSSEKKVVLQPAAVEFHAGEAAPVFRLSDLEGNLESLEDYRGKLVLLNFWATWCVPCVAEMESLERLYGKYKDKGFVVLAVSVDPRNAALQIDRFKKDKKLTFPILLDPEMSMMEPYGITGFPESFFVDPEGRFVSVKDPSTQKEGVRIISDRNWASTDYLELVSELLHRQPG